MADIVFKIVAVLTTLIGVSGVLLTLFAAALGAVTNYDAAKEAARFAMVPAIIAAVGVFLIVKAF